MKDIRKKIFDMKCEGILLCYSPEQQKVFKILAGRPLSSVSKHHMKNVKKSKKLWEILINIRNEELPLKSDGTVDMTNYKRIDIEKYLYNEIDNLVKYTFLTQVFDYIGIPVMDISEMPGVHRPEECFL